MPKKVAVIYGGYSEESEISRSSAKAVFNAISSAFEAYLVHISPDHWDCEINSNSYPINKSDFTVSLDGKKLSFDAVFNAIHGDPGENGKLAAYFDLLNIPQSSCSFEVSSLTFSKWQCNQVLKSLGFYVSESYLVLNSTPSIANEELVSLGLPFFLKPNKNGSSFGISKIKSRDEISSALQTIFEMDTEAIAEKLLVGTEVTCGVYSINGEIHSLPVTEIVSENEYFDYQAKYEGASDEITPARITPELTKNVQETAKDVYEKMSLSGLVRIDFILNDDLPYIIEINTVPGMTEESIIPKQLNEAGISPNQFFVDLMNNILD